MKSIIPPTYADIHNYEKENTHVFFAKYPETGIDINPNKRYAFEAPFIDRTSICAESNRHIPWMGDMDVICPHIDERVYACLSHLYPETMPSKERLILTDFSGTSRSYIQKIKELGEKAVVTHPYQDLEDQHHYLSKDLIYHMNQKENAHLYSSYTNKKELFAIDDVVFNSEQPFVLKTSIPSASGDWCAIFHKETHNKPYFNQIINEWKTKGHTHMVYEDFLDIKQSYNVGVSILANGDVFVDKISFQRVDEKWVYGGNIYLDHLITDDLKQYTNIIVQDLWKKLYEAGFPWGKIWFDMAQVQTILTGTDDLKVYDLNIRPNGSSPVNILSSQIKNHMQSTHKQSIDELGLYYGSFEVSGKTQEEILKAFTSNPDHVSGAYDIYPLSLCTDKESWKTKGYGVVPVLWAGNISQAEKLYAQQKKTLENKWIILS